MVDAPLTLPSPPPLDDACALFLDVDGTLIDFAERPDQVFLLPEVRELIAHISTRLDGALALVSGRPLAQLDQLFAPLQLPAAGMHGHQIRAHAGDTRTLTHRTAPAALGLVQQQALQLAQAHPGVLVEDKTTSLALHWRGRPQAETAVLEFAQTQIKQLPDYRLQAGNHVIEFVPAGSDKGSAIEHMLSLSPFRNRMPIFIGDDLTDEFGFAATNRLAGWSVLVGHRQRSQARYALADIGAVHAWLRDFAGGSR